MANIKINDIKPAGADLFADDESLLTELKDNEISAVFGGAVAAIVPLSSTFSIKCVCNVKNKALAV
jgi:hypothetical protein